MISEQLQAIIDSAPEDFASPSADYREVRRVMAPFHGHPVGSNIALEEVSLGGVRCGFYHTPTASRSGKRILHLHGGGFVSCPLDDYHFYGELLLKQLGHCVVMPDYRLAPEAPYPAAIEDAVSAYGGLLEDGTDPLDIVVVGESCGALLAICMLNRARAAGLPMPAAFISVTGWFELDVQFSPPGRDPFLTPEWLRNRGLDFSAGKVALTAPEISPCHAELAGLPPLFLQVGQNDTAAPGALEFARRATLAGVQVRLESWPGMIQGWHGLVNAGVPEAQAAWDDIRDYVTAVFAGDSRAPTNAG